MKVLRSARGADIEREIREVVMEVKGAGLGGEGGREARGARGTGKVRVVLVLDQPDLVLAAMGDDGMGMEMAEVVASLRSVSLPFGPISSVPSLFTPVFRET